MAPAFGKMVGPLPLGAWIAVVGGGLGFALYTRNQSADNSTPQVVEDTGGVPGVGTGGSGQWTDLTVPATGTGGNGSAAPKPTTNEEWGVAATNWLIGQGYNPAVSDSAVRKYLGMESMSAQEFALITAALGHLGAPPQVLPPPIFAPPTMPKPPTTTPKPPVVAKPPPVSKPPAPKPSVRYYTVRPGDSLSRISNKYYRTTTQWGRIYNANRYGVRRADGSKGMIRNPNLIFPGWKLVIP